MKVGLICFLRGDELGIRIWTMDGYDVKSVSALGTVFYFFLFSVPDTLAFALQDSVLKRQRRDEDEMKIEAGTRPAPHHTRPPPGLSQLMQ